MDFVACSLDLRWLFADVRWMFIGLRWVSLDSVIVLWFFVGFPLDFICVSAGFLCGRSADFVGCPLDVRWASIWFSWDSLGFSLGVRWPFVGYSVDIRCIIAVDVGWASVALPLNFRSLLAGLLRVVGFDLHAHWIFA